MLVLLLIGVFLPWGFVVGDPPPFPAPATRRVEAIVHTPWELQELRFTQPRPLRVWSVRIALDSPNLAFQVTEADARALPKETLSETALAFAKRTRAAITINASPFGPIHAMAGKPVDIAGISAQLGHVYSSPEANYGALVFDSIRRAQILTGPIDPSKLADTVCGVGGFTVVLDHGRNLPFESRTAAAEKGAKNKKETDPLHPRTAVGLDRTQTNLYLLIVDGRQPGVSEGVGLVELAELGRQLGADTLLNLDGGGSTTLVVNPDGSKPRVVNTPTPRPGLSNILRQNGNHLGIHFYRSPDALTAEQLQAIMPKLPIAKIPIFLGPLNQVMTKFQIDTPLRRAAFLAQLAHESGQLVYMEEIASGAAYEGRKDLGNTEPGDGKRFKGRGPIQLTGRANYRRAEKDLLLPLEANPTLAAKPAVGCLIAGWYWNKHGLNTWADAEDFTTITKKINGGLRGQKDRLYFYTKAREVLGLPPYTPKPPVDAPAKQSAAAPKT